mmetsp:Transcript_29539/g.47220  ORF Transcript_29539/g.47220 Transcript_29539/m.47220 type:complete len:539 (+) Transcript_29539:192-1808(+)
MWCEGNLVLGDAPGMGKTVQCCEYASSLCDSIPYVETEKTLIPKEDVVEAGEILNEKLENIDNVDQCKEDWQATKKAWLTLVPGEYVPYTLPSMVSYTCGTSLLHAVFFKYLLKRFTLNKHQRVVILCGGSGAEIAGLQLAGIHPDHIDIVDIHNHWNNFGNKRRRKSAKFHCIDLLANPESISDMVARADLVYLMYGLTELADRDRQNTQKLIETVLENLATDAALFVVDPIKTRHGKDLWIDQIALKHCKTERFQMKTTIQQQHVTETKLYKWIQKLKLKLNEDIKLSMHIWGRRYTKIQTAAATTNKEKRIVVYITKDNKHIEYCKKWIQPNKPIFTLGPTSTNKLKKSAIWHLQSAIQGAQHAIVLLSFNQIEYAQNIQTHTLIIDQAETFLQYQNSKNIIKQLQTFKNTKRTIIACSKPQYHKQAANIANATIHTTHNIHASPKQRANDIFGINILVCNPCKDQTCLLDKNTQTNIQKIKDINNDPNPIQTRDIVIFKQQNIPEQRIQNIIDSIIPKVAHKNTSHKIVKIHIR